MTHKQRQKIERIKAEFFHNYCRGKPDDYEIKTWEIRDCRNYQAVYIAVGKMKETYIEARVTREHGHFFVYPSGRVIIPGSEARNWKKFYTLEDIELYDLKPEEPDESPERKNRK